jgi:hypothetical protein
MIAAPEYVCCCEFKVKCDEGDTNGILESERNQRNNAKLQIDGRHRHEYAPVSHARTSTANVECCMQIINGLHHMAVIINGRCETRSFLNYMGKV